MNEQQQERFARLFRPDDDDSTEPCNRCGQPVYVLQPPRYHFQLEEFYPAGYVTRYVFCSRLCLAIWAGGQVALRSRDLEDYCPVCGERLDEAGACRCTRKEGQP